MRGGQNTKSTYFFPQGGGGSPHIQMVLLCSHPSCDNEWDNRKRSRNNGEGSLYVGVNK